MVKDNVCLIVIDGWGISDETEGKKHYSFLFFFLFG